MCRSPETLPIPQVTEVGGSGCAWNGTVANDCNAGTILTITGTHFAPYITPEVTVSNTRCPLHRTSGRTRNVIICTASASLPRGQVLPLQVSLGSVSSRSYQAVLFRATDGQPSSTARNVGPTGNAAVTVPQHMTIEEELIVTGLSVTMGVVLLVGAICGVGWWMGKRQGERGTTPGGADEALPQ